MSQSELLFEKAKTLIPGGVNSPVRSFQSVGGNPLFIKKAQGPYIIDADDKRYIDYVGSWGPAILGHAHPTIVKKVQEAAANGLSFGAPTNAEILLAEKICQHYPAVETVRFVSSGTEAAMSAIRLARGFTARNKILKFEGCYHGHSDSLLVKSGSGALTFGVPSSLGVPAAFTKETCTAIYNDLDSVEQVFATAGSDIAAIIVEPVAANMNLILPKPGFLEGLRQICDKYQALLIFDEVITGFRLGIGGAQQYFKIKPDLTIFGKVIGGGMPVGAFGGNKEIMNFIAPLGGVYQAGTLSGNPIAMAAGLATLTEIENHPNFYAELAQKTQNLCKGLNAEAQQYNIPLQVKSIGSLFGLFFTAQPKIESLSDVSQCDIERFKLFFHAMLQQGIYLAPSAFEAGFVSIAHGQDEIEQTIAASKEVFKEL